MVRRGYFQTHPFTLKMTTKMFAETLETFDAAYPRKPKLCTIHTIIKDLIQSATRQASDAVCMQPPYS
jgi:hypothetical protein